ncbi:diguanylate cyclase [Pseudomonas solani]|uniref:diguanylate cyclase n=1 Tax=Pseudomonas solani TaxID=2731552 RepID=UPI003C3086F5
MNTRHVPMTRLRHLILLLTLLACIATLANGLYAAYRVQKAALLETALENNRAYAAKMASSIGTQLQAAQQQLAYSATQLGQHFADPQTLAAEARRLDLQDAGFNAIAVVAADGTVLVSTPDAPQVDGSGRSPGIDEALRARAPLISAPFNAVSGRLVVFISQPVLGATDQYLGLVGGAIYMRKDNLLHGLIGHHFHQDAYVYLIDASRLLLYHPQPERVGQRVGASAVDDAVLAGGSGTLAYVNSKGVEMLSGYASVPGTGWGVVSQQPRAATLAALDGLVHQVLMAAMPMALLGFVVLWWVAQLIARPLRLLAGSARQMGEPGSPEHLAAVSAWYFEAAHIKQALLTGIGLVQEKLGRLNHAAQTDPLTGLLNRRAMEDALVSIEAGARNLAVVALDIDHFKQVNDRFGHDAGDRALKVVAAVMRACSRDRDLPCRVGGEEFLLLLPGTTLAEAAEVGERLRQSVEDARTEGVGQVTISLGVADWVPGGRSLEATFKQADEMMYRAKRQGRNQVVVESAER